VRTPGCCVDLGDLDDWMDAAECEESDWTAVSIGHPPTHIRLRHGRLEVSGSDDVPPGDDAPAGAGPAVVARIDPVALTAAAVVADEARGRFAARLRTVLSSGLNGPVADLVQTDIDRAVAALIFLGGSET
jgi:hypothetical protein